MSYVVTAPLVLAVDEGGHTHHVYRGGLIGWLSPAQEEHFLAEGMVAEVVDEQGEGPVEVTGVEAAEEVDLDDDGTDGDGEGDSGDDEDGKPLRAAPKAAWVEHAITRHGVDREDAEAFSKSELIELYG